MYIVDSIMGSGKTSAAINLVNSLSPQYHVLIVTPYLTETDRFIQSCPLKNIRQPVERPTKLADIKRKIARGKNIATTHSLFNDFDIETAKLIAEHNYILIIDESPTVLSDGYISDDDLKCLIDSGLVEIEGERVLRWLKPRYTGTFKEVKHACENERLNIAKNNVVIDVYPAKIFNAFREVYILTFMFEAQILRYYLDYHEVQFSYLGVEKTSESEYRFVHVDEPDHSPPEGIQINFPATRKMNEIGKKRDNLSYHWYHGGKSTAEDIERLQKHCVNFFQNITNTPVSRNLWTTYKDCKSGLSGRRYARGFLACNAKATNEYREKTAVAYLINRGFNPNYRAFFANKGIGVNQEAFALSEMLQFIWRSAVRDGKPIDLYIPSSRMRNLLKNWLEEKK